MKHISIPAQITTVEDRIVGNLTLTQLVLLAAPIFTGFIVYAALPPNLRISLYKIILIMIVSVIFFVSAIKARGKLILFWGLILARYSFRSKLYVFDKNVNSKSDEKHIENLIDVARTDTETEQPLTFNPQEVKSLLDKTHTRLSYIKERKGKLYVYVTKA